MSTSLTNGLKLLEVLDGAVTEQAGPELGRLSGINAATAGRLLRSLERSGYVVQDRRSGKFGIGQRCQNLGQAWFRSQVLTSQALSLVAEFARMHRVSVYLAAPQRDAVIYLHVCEDYGVVATRTRPGDSSPWHSTAIGRALLFDKTSAETAALLGALALDRLTHRTTTDPAELQARLAQERADGIAVNREETLLGVASLGAPLRDADGRITSAISIAIPTSSTHVSELANLRGPLMSLADTLSRAPIFPETPAR